MFFFRWSPVEKVGDVYSSLYKLMLEAHMLDKFVLLSPSPLKLGFAAQKYALLYAAPPPPSQNYTPLMYRGNGVRGFLRSSRTCVRIVDYKNLFNLSLIYYLFLPIMWSVLPNMNTIMRYPLITLRRRIQKGHLLVSM